jgi:small subunit ribosomal protein S1
MEEIATTEAATKIKVPTRFDSLKQKYKGRTSGTMGIEQDIAFSYEDFASSVKNTEYGFQRDAIVHGVAMEYAGTGALIDIGAKASAYLPEQEAALTLLDGQSIVDVIPLDTQMEFQIISEENEDGQLLVSIRRLQYKKAWDAVVKLAEGDAIIQAPVIQVNRGGAICLVEGLRAFLPGSHLSGRLPDDNLVGEILSLKFLEVNTETNKLVVSNRKAVVEAQMADLSRGDLVEGIIKALKPYGAFVEVGGMSGLLHISQISYDRIDDLEKVLQPGMRVKCMIIDHDKVNGRIALSTKTLEPQPGDMLRDPGMVFEKAEETAMAYHAKMEKERQQREEAARDVVLSLGDSLDDFGSGSDGDSIDPLQDVSDSLDSLLS